MKTYEEIMKAGELLKEWLATGFITEEEYEQKKEHLIKAFHEMMDESFED